MQCINKMDMEEVICRLEILKIQARTYSCCDYLGLMEYRIKENFSANFEMEKLINEDCRKKMIDWSFRVADHFNVNREFVAISTNYLDRFLSIYICDRTSFKLAALTTLYMAAKIYGTCNRSAIPLMILVQLSEGEFEVEHVLKMERVILSALNWAMHPPTTAEFVNLYMRVFALQNIKNTSRHINKSALFVAELAISDYFFVSYEPSTIALAAIFNTLEHEEISAYAFSEFLSKISCNNRSFAHKNVDAARNRLLELQKQKTFSGKRDDSLSNRVGAEVQRAFDSKGESNKVTPISPTCISRCC